MAGPGEAGPARRRHAPGMSETSLLASALDELRFRLQGGVHEPGDAAYDDACTLFTR